MTKTEKERAAWIAAGARELDRTLRATYAASMRGAAARRRFTFREIGTWLGVGGQRVRELIRGDEPK